MVHSWKKPQTLKKRHSSFPGEMNRRSRNGPHVFGFKSLQLPDSLGCDANDGDAIKSSRPNTSHVESKPLLYWEEPTSMQDLEEPLSGDTGTGSQSLIFESLIRHYHSKIFQGSGLRNQQRMTRRSKVESTTDATPGLSVAKPLSADLADDTRYECRLVRINLHAVLLVDTKDNLNTFHEYN